MDINAHTLASVYRGVSTAFNQGFDSAQTVYKRIAMEVSSTTAMNEYPRLDGLPGMREWIGDRLIHDLSASTYTIRNKSFESTISIKRENIEDDQVGIFTPAVTEMGRAAAEQPDQLTFGLARVAQSTTGIDGQFFFDTDHPSWNAAGAVVSASNWGGGSGGLWMLVDDTRVLKPFVFQRRKKPALVRMDKENDENVFMKKEFLYGVDSRCNVGFGMWQLAFGSRQALTPASYAAARAAMMSRFRSDGTPLPVTPSLLVVGPGLEDAARSVLTSETVVEGGVAVSNRWKGTAELLMTPWMV
jgi:phage major head subunit gpT-like protein